MNETVKVSILIPAYNSEKYIDQCLESAMNQTLREIEILVVDDCSTDATLAHIEAAAERDSRVRVIRHEENRGTLQSRKDAVLASRGEYVMFMDNDDYLELDACKIAYTKAVEAGVDILHYSRFSENCGNRSESRINSTKAIFPPWFVGTIAEPLVSACFEKKLFKWLLWDKLYRGDLARSVYTRMPENMYIVYSEDAYQSFFLLLSCKSYLGIKNQLYHHYSDRGITRNRLLNLKTFHRFCDCAEMSRAIDRDLAALESETPVDDQKAELFAAAHRAAEACRNHHLRELIKIWLNKVRPEDQAEAYLMMEQAWQTESSFFVGLLAENAWDKRKEIAEALTGADWLKYEGRPVKTIGLYYWRFRNGGTERVVTQLGSLLAELRDEKGRTKYRVVLISDEAPNEEDYPISPLVMREELPPFRESTGENYAPRAEKWQEIIAKHRIDTVFYSQWAEPILLWDLLSVKRAEGHPAFVIHTHNFCGTQYKGQTLSMKERSEIRRLADGIVTLSETDRLYWSRCNPRSVYIPNPCFVKTGECRRAVYGKHILWLARIATQKQPLEIPRIMREVCARDPEIICHVVGADDAKLEKELQERIAAEGLSENILLEGFRADVTPFYEKSALFLMTSGIEGFALTLFEAAAYGLPTVLYEMPWLAYNDLIDGAIAVPQRDASAAAEAIVRIVNDPEEWQRRSDAIYNSALRYEKTDITAYWMALIESLEKGTFPDKPRFDRDTEILLDQIDEFHDNAVRDLTQQRDQERKKVKNLERKLNSRDRELESVKGSVSFRVGRALTWAPRKVRGLVRCCREHDAKYTFERILFHLHLGPDNEKRGE